MNIQGFQFLTDDAVICPDSLPIALHSGPLGARCGNTPLLPSKDRRALTVVLNLYAVAGTTIKLSSLRWADRPLGQAAHNHIRNALVPVTPKIKMGNLLRRSPAAVQVLVTWAFVVVPSDVPFRDMDMSLVDVRLVSVSETADLDVSGGPSCLVRSGRRCHYSRVCRPTFGSSNVPAGDSSLFTRDISYRRGQGRGPSAGR